MATKIVLEGLAVILPVALTVYAVNWLGGILRFALSGEIYISGWVSLLAFCSCRHVPLIAAGILILAATWPYRSTVRPILVNNLVAL